MAHGDMGPIAQFRPVRWEVQRGGAIHPDGTPCRARIGQVLEIVPAVPGWLAVSRCGPGEEGRRQIVCGVLVERCGWARSVWNGPEGNHL